VKDVLEEQKELDVNQAEILEKEKERAKDNTQPDNQWQLLANSMKRGTGKSTSATSAPKGLKGLLSEVTRDAIIPLLVGTGEGLASGLVAASTPIITALGGIAAGLGVAWAAFKGIEILKTVQQEQLDKVNAGGSPLGYAAVTGAMQGLGAAVGIPNLGLQTTKAATRPAGKSVDRVVGGVTVAPDGKQTMSDAGMERLIAREGGIKTVAYEDPEGSGNYAIGPGLHTFQGKKVVRGQTASVDALRDDARKQMDTHYASVVRNQLPGIIDQNKFDSLASVAWNSEAAGANLAKKYVAKGTLTKEDYTASAFIGQTPDEGLRTRRIGEYEQGAQPSTVSTPAPIAQVITPSPTMTVATPTPARSGLAVALATTSVGREAGATPTIVISAPQVQTPSPVARPEPIYVPIQVDSLDNAVRAVKNTSGSPLN
jgi:GH24 family phage-related lysozyme (muramidase)